MKQAFIINGAGGAGKDTFVNYIQEKRPYIFNISSVTEVKRIAAEFFGWKGEKTLKWRKILSDIKNVQTEACNGPFKYMKREWDNADIDDVLFFHVREPEEIAKMVELTGAQTVLIKRSEVEEQVVYGNMADDGVYDYDYDIVVINDTLPQLNDSATLFINKFIKVI